MCVRVQKLFSKLSLRFVDGCYFRSSFKLPPFQCPVRAYSILAPGRIKDFRFPSAASITFNPSVNCLSVANEHLFLKPTVAAVLSGHRNSSTEKEPTGDTKSLSKARENPYGHLTVGQKVKEAGKDASYTVVILVGFGVTGLMFYVIGRELLSSESPSGVYGDALKKCQNNIEVAAALGEPIKGYGETTRRGRRRHVSHTEFEVRGVPHMRLRFYMEGPYRKATVHVEVQKGDSGKYEYRYLVVETEGYPHRTFVLEDAR